MSFRVSIEEMGGEFHIILGFTTASSRRRIFSSRHAKSLSKGID